MTQPARKNPPGATGGPSILNARVRNAKDRYTSDQILSAIRVASQIRFLCRYIIDLNEIYRRRSVEPDQITDRKLLSGQIAQAFELYRNCWSTHLRKDFERLFGIKFEHFEEALQEMAWRIDEPIGLYGAAIPEPVEDRLVQL